MPSPGSPVRRPCLGWVRVPGGMLCSDGKRRKPWKARTVDLFLFTLGQVLDDAVRQGLLARSVVALVDRLPPATPTADHVHRARGGATPPCRARRLARARVAPRAVWPSQG